MVLRGRADDRTRLCRPFGSRWQRWMRHPEMRAAVRAVIRADLLFGHYREPPQIRASQKKSDKQRRLAKIQERFTQ